LALVLAWPGRSLSTGRVFKALQAFSNPPIPDVDLARLGNMEAVVDLLDRTRNDLEETAIALEPVIADALSALHRLPGCRFVRMSGSGSTCFGLFHDLEKARAAAADLAGRHGVWWVRAVTACGPPPGANPE
jgi:4-diphosphocytidyl-2-C-methyl-D-erythritol kinase